tara:strand:- start:93 stop:335 length:243 start_codon:yes stop_codon:yes gene_type:complete
MGADLSHSHIIRPTTQDAIRVDNIKAARLTRYELPGWERVVRYLEYIEDMYNIYAYLRECFDAIPFRSSPLPSTYLYPGR